MKQIKELEKRFIELFETFKKIIPNTQQITLDVYEYGFKPGICINGFYHIGKECIMLHSIDDLIRLSILFRKFK